MIYLLIANSSLLFFYLIYVLFLKKLTFFQWNRAYLLSALLISFLLPIVQLLDLGIEKQVLIATFTMPVIDLTNTTNEKTILELLNDWNWLFIVYMVGSIIATMLFIYRLFLLKKSLQSTEESHHSFSFFNRIVVGTKVEDHHLISKHEQVHASQKHSLDVLIIELFRVFNWFNPVFYFYLKEMKFQHECIADAICAENNKVYYAELLVANAMQISPNVLSHHFSSNSYLKKRIMYLFKNKTKKINQWRYSAVIPLVVGVTIISIACNQQNKGKVGAADSVVEASASNNAIDQASVANVPDSIVPTEEQVKFPEPKTVAAQKQEKVHFPEPKSDRNITQIKKDVEKETGAARITLKGTKQENSIETQEGSFGPVDGKDMLFVTTQVAPEPPGGINAFRKWIGDNYVYPQAAIDEGNKGVVEVYFVVEKDGSLTNFKVLKDIGHGTGEAAVNVLKKSQKWKAAVQNTRNVRAEFKLPIRLDLTSM